VSLPRPPLLVITDRHQSTGPLAATVEAILAAGCRWVSLREKDLPPAERLDLLQQLASLARPWNARISVHDDIAAAFAAGTGLHLPAGGSPLAARERLGPQALIGISTHSIAEIHAAKAAGADYVTFSPIFESESKPGYGPALGLAALAQATRIGIPVLALGGVTAENADDCLAAGAAGVAVMGPIMRAKDPKAAAALCLSIVAAGPNPHISPGEEN
jgi:thiamine-phosphate pyrophosphorylase